jgi:hypothetical protein
MSDSSSKNDINTPEQPDGIGSSTELHQKISQSIIKISHCRPLAVVTDPPAAGSSECWDRYDQQLPNGEYDWVDNVTQIVTSLSRGSISRCSTFCAMARLRPRPWVEGPSGQSQARHPFACFRSRTLSGEGVACTSGSGTFPAMHCVDNDGNRDSPPLSFAQCFV